MDQVVPWKGLITLIEPHYPKGDGGRPAYPLMAMLRVHLMQNWFGYSDPAMEEALYETTILRQFSGLHLDRIPDETTILNFRRLLEKHELAGGILQVINGSLGDRGLMLLQGTVVDQLLHGEEFYVSGDAGYTGVDKRPEHQNRKMIWSIAARPSSYKKHGKQSLIGSLRRKIEYAKAQVRAKVEHPFRVIKRQFGYTKVRFRGLMKNTAQRATLFALSNLWMMRKRLLVAGEVRL